MPPKNDTVREREKLRKQGLRDSIKKAINTKDELKTATFLDDRKDLVDNTYVEKQRISSETPGFSDFVAAHKWGDRQNLTPAWPYRGASACKFFEDVYSKWLTDGYISERDLQLLDPRLVGQIQQELHKGATRPKGLVPEYSAQILDIEDVFEREVARRLRCRAAENRRRQRSKNARPESAPKTPEP